MDKPFSPKKHNQYTYNTWHLAQACTFPTTRKAANFDLTQIQDTKL